jgi:hypothetical protein
MRINISIQQIFSLLIIVGLLLSGIYSARGLYADGSYFLFQVLTLQGFEVTDAPRSFALFLSQLPLVVAIKLGIKDLNVLIRLHSFGLIGIPLSLWIYALYLQLNKNIFWLFILAFSASYLSSGFFAIGEYNLCYALCALCVSIMCNQTRSHTNFIILIFASSFLIKSYEAMIFMGPLLCLIAGYRIYSKIDSSIFKKICLLISTSLFLTGFTIALRALMYLRSAQSTSDAANLIGSFQSTQFAYLSVLTICIITYFFTNNKKYINIALSSAILCSLLFILHKSSWQSPYMSYSFRAMSGLLLCAILFIIFIYYFFGEVYLPIKRNQFNSTLSFVGFTLTISLCIPFYYNTFGYIKWISSVEQQALNISTSTPIDLTTINIDHGWNSGFNWMWTNTTLSIILRGNAQAIILNNSHYHDWEPFDPKVVDPYILNSYYKITPIFK